MNEGRIFKLGDRSRRFKFTQRSKFRLSDSGLTYEELTQGTRSFANVCALLYALLDEPNPKITLEDIAESIEGREAEAAELAVNCLIDGGVVSADDVPGDNSESAPGSADDPKSPGPKTSHSPESTSD